MKTKNIIVVGAGLVGSLLALVLAKRGHRVRVFEHRDDMRRVDMPAGRSINLAISDRGWRALARVGVEDEVRAMALPMKGRRMHATDGAMTFQPYGAGDQCIWSVSRGGLNKLLMERSEEHEGTSFHFGQRVTSVDFDKPAIRVVDEATGEERTEEADHIFGADGAFSAVRLSMMFRGRFDYRQDYLSHSYKELSIPPKAEGAAQDDPSRFHIAPDGLHIWPRGGYMLIALPNPDGSFTVTLFLAHKGAYPSFETIDTPAKVETFFNESFPDVVPFLPNLTQEFLGNPTGDLATFRCAPWNVDGKVCLLGDAAHGIVPFYGQGMVSGFEDCRVLADLMDELGEDSDDYDTLFQRFFEARKDNGDAIADLALHNFVEMRDRVADPKFLLQKKIEARISKRYGDAYLPLYSMVSFSHIPYAEALKKGREHDAFMKRIMAMENIETRWESAEVDAAIEQELGPPPA
jgi:kynurenine 3-monooxygenase